MTRAPQNPLPTGDESPAAAFDHDTTRRALDELFNVARQYRSSTEYWELLQFIARFRAYSPFNAMLVRIQRPGTVFVAPACRWSSHYGRRIRPGAHPLVILQPMGPVMFVFDVSDTEPDGDGGRLPLEVERPFEVRGGRVGPELDRTIENARRDGVRVTLSDQGFQGAGWIQCVPPGQFQQFLVRQKAPPQIIHVPIRYALVLNPSHSPETRYATLVHELAHLYCGHLSTPNEKWWPDRRDLQEQIAEFEAESVSYLVCRRLGLDTPSEKYLADYSGHEQEIPPISLDCVMKTAGLIEQMGQERLKPRKERGA